METKELGSMEFLILRERLYRVWLQTSEECGHWYLWSLKERPPHWCCCVRNSEKNSTERIVQQIHRAGTQTSGESTPSNWSLNFWGDTVRLLLGMWGKPNQLVTGTDWESIAAYRMKNRYQGDDGRKEVKQKATSPSSPSGFLFLCCILFGHTRQSPKSQRWE